MRPLSGLRRLLFSPVLLVPLIFLFSLAARGTCYGPGNYYPPVQGTTHIESISPQVALPGVTPVFIQGYCFGDGRGSGSITLSGETMTNIVFWTDAEIEFIPPFDATSGNLVVTSSSYGSDSSANEAGCPGNYVGGVNWDYCGNGEIDATFTIATVNAPVYWLEPLGGAQSAPQYVAGTWVFANGPAATTITLTQGAQNSDGTWPITGTQDNW
jgi:IPT/TIG domain